ncbi:MAG: hypothetical protein JRN46_02370 [Nitrososphaerota archaeon]|nr:hypothetical protein [Nitrososphaerota archaeon]
MTFRGSHERISGGKARSGSRRPTGVLLVLALLITGSMVLLPLAGKVSAAVPALNGFCGATSGTKSTSCSLTTSGAGNVIIVFVWTSSGTPGTPTTSGVTYSARNTGSTAGGTVSEFYATGVGALSSATVSDTISGGSSPKSGIIAFGVSGITGGPFDPNLVTAPAATTGTSGGSPSVTFTTTGTSDFIIGFLGQASRTNPTAGSGFKKITVHFTTGRSVAAEYRTVTSTGSQTPDWATAAGAWVMLGDALDTSPSDVPEFPLGVLPLLLVIPVMYVVAKRARPLRPEGATLLLLAIPIVYILIGRRTLDVGRVGASK